MRPLATRNLFLALQSLSDNPGILNMLRIRVLHSSERLNALKPNSEAVQPNGRGVEKFTTTTTTSPAAAIT